jgi:hypothetical protein
MKKVLSLMIVVSMFLMFGCSKTTVEDAAKAYVKKQFEISKDAKLDLSKLKYTVTEEGDEKATVNVVGTIAYEQQIFLVKDGRKWKVGTKKAEPVKQTAPTEKVEPEAHHVEH